MMDAARFPRLAAGVMLCLLVGCATTPVQDPMPLVLPETFAASADGSMIGAYSSATWWEALDDPLLAALIETGLERGLTIQSAQAQIMQARAGLGQANADLLPSAVLGTTALRVGNTSASAPSYSANFDASWEVPLLSGGLLARRASQAGLAAAEADYFATRLSLAAEIAQTYAAIRSIQAATSILEAQIERQTSIRDIVAARLEFGSASRLDMARAESQLSTLMATLPGLRTQNTQTLNQLAVLTGAVPGSLNAQFDSVRAVPRFASLPPPGTPADLLANRPDILAAERRLEAARLNVGVARSQYFPQVSVGASVSSPASGAQGGARSFSALFDADTAGFSIGPSLSWRILDFANLNAAIDQAKGRERAALVAYKSTILQALLDVENALVGVTNASQALDLSLAALGTNREAADISRGQYLDGAIDLSDLLIVQNDLSAAENAANNARLAYATAQLAYVKAIGAGW